MKTFSQLAPVLLLSVTALHASTVVTYPVPTNLENIAVSASGDLFVTGSFLDGIIYRISPGGSSQVFGQVPIFAAGAAFDTNGNLIVASNTSIYQFRPDGTRSLVTDIAGAGILTE